MTHKTVPVEPTEEMYAAAEREWDGRMSARSAGVWKAMLDAAPQVQDSGETRFDDPERVYDNQREYIGTLERELAATREEIAQLKLEAMKLRGDADSARFMAGIAARKP